MIHILEQTFKEYCSRKRGRGDRRKKYFRHICPQDLLSYFVKLKDKLGNSLLPDLQESNGNIMDTLGPTEKEFIVDFYKDSLLPVSNLTIIQATVCGIGMNNDTISQSINVNLAKFDDNPF